MRVAGCLIVALHPGSLLFLFLYREVGLDLLLLLQVLVQPLLRLLQLLLQLLLFGRVGLGLAELFEVGLDLIVLVADELCDLLQSQRRVFARVVVFVPLGRLHHLQVLSGHLRDHVNHLRLGVHRSQNTPTPSSLTVDLPRALVGCLGRMNLSEAHNCGLFCCVNRNMSYGAKFSQLAVDVLSYFLADCNLRSGVIRCLYGQVLDIDREAPVFYLCRAQLWHLDVRWRACGASRSVRTLLLYGIVSHDLWRWSLLAKA